MKKLFKPAGILLNLLSLAVFFIIGMYFAGLIEAGKNQGLAGGAIVLGWGILFAGAAFILSFFVSFHVAHKKIVRINWILFVLLLIGYGITHYRFIQRDKLQQEKSKQFKPAPTKPTPMAEPVKEPTAMLVSNLKTIVAETRLAKLDATMGMGYFSPNYFENSTLYFYGNLDLEKSLMNHSPFDSITFKRNKFGQFEIATAPPWLVPGILKMDYDLLYFKIESITQDFVEIVVDEHSGKTSFVNRNTGRIIYWPDFLLSVNSVEFLSESSEKVRARSFSTSGEINTQYEFMHPVRVKGEWMKVLLMDSNFNKVAMGWIQWKRDNKLLITYNLLS
jgi:hypothetical protein